jgi:hypothetical protein
VPKRQYIREDGRREGAKRRKNIKEMRISRKDGRKEGGKEGEKEVKERGKGGREGRK